MGEINFCDGRRLGRNRLGHQVFGRVFYNGGPLDAQVLVRTYDPHSPLTLFCLLKAHLDLFVDKDWSQIAVRQVPDREPMIGEDGEHHDQEQGPVDEQIAIALNLAAVLALEMDSVGVEGERREAEECCASESEGLRVLRDEGGI